MNDQPAPFRGIAVADEAANANDRLRHIVGQIDTLHDAGFSGVSDRQRVADAWRLLRFIRETVVGPRAW